jgi:hypothetical protein
MYVTGQQRHNQAMLAPSRKDEKAIVQMLRGLQDYQNLLDASDTETRAVLNQGLSDIARGLQKLAQGPLGRLDAEILASDLAPFVVEQNLTLVGEEVGREADQEDDPAAEQTAAQDIG